MATQKPVLAKKPLFEYANCVKYKSVKTKKGTEKMKKQKMPTPKEIEAKRAKLLAVAEAEARNAKRGPTKTFLYQIEKEIDEMFGMGLTMSKVSEIIKEVYGVRVSTNTISSFNKERKQTEADLQDNEQERTDVQ